MRILILAPLFTLIEPVGSLQAISFLFLPYNMLMDALRLISLNTNGIRQTSKRKALFYKLRNFDADFVMLQEIHSTQQDQKIWLSEWGGDGVFAHGKSNSRGVCTLMKRGCASSITCTIGDPDGRFLITQIKRQEEHITLVNVYAPTQNEANNQISLIRKLHETLGNLEIHTLIIAGNFNVQLNLPGATTPPAAGGKETYADHIQTLLQDYNIVDAWREKNTSSKKGTFHRGQYSARLDYFFLPSFLLPSISTLKIVPEPLSDHCMLDLELNTANVKRGPGY